MTTRFRQPRPTDVPPAWIIEQLPSSSPSIEPPRPWAERPSLPEWDEPPAEEETAPTGGTVIVIDL